MKPADLLASMAAHGAIARFASILDHGNPTALCGGAGSTSSFIVAALAGATGRTILMVVPHLDDADVAAEELAGLGVDAIRLPALELVPGESAVHMELFAERVGALRRITGPHNARPRIIVAPIHALMQGAADGDDLDAVSRRVAPGDRLDPDDLVRWLDSAGYRRTGVAEEPGDFAVRGGIIDVFAPGGLDTAGGPVRLDFFGDEVESILEVDPETMGSDRRLGSVELIAADLGRVRAIASTCPVDLLPSQFLAVVCETAEVSEQGRGYFERITDATGVFSPAAVFKSMREQSHAVGEINQFSAGSEEGERITLDAAPLPDLAQQSTEAVAQLGSLDPEHVVVCCRNEGERQRFDELAAQHLKDAHVQVTSLVLFINRGFIWDGRIAIVPYHELLHRFHAHRRVRRFHSGRAMDTFLQFAPGDYVVHAEYGIARFVGLRTMPRKGGAGEQIEEYLTLEFARRAKLHVPATRIDVVQKYVGAMRTEPKLATIGGRAWKQQTHRVAESVKDLAGDLLRLRAAREAAPGIRYPADTPWQREFEASFGYEETDDQLAALAAIKRDMQSERPMDRLVCGDVGFGKTEVAIRAAFKAVEFGRQVAVLVPTTVLAEQHERTLRERFADYPFRVESVSRFKTDAKAGAILKAVRKGHVDVIVGTHRLLSKDVAFADLGLVIIDEEQRFGVEHKEALLRMRMAADVLTLSATPIPRTLHTSLLGLRDISSLVTAPADRQAVVTEVVPHDEHRLRRAIERELARDGQVFYVHNRINDIRSVADDVQRLAPDARIVVGHGRMPARELEQVMLAFLRHQADILVSTTIIESGIDIPTVNTMIIDDADRYGLADLHQLRGRVGRYKHRAYCYLLLPTTRTVAGAARERLKAIEQFSMLGAGFRIAMRDLELRGAGNLLGPEQSGHIAAVGYDMYCRLLEKAVRELTGETAAQPSTTTIEIGIGGIIPKNYIPSDARRMEAYRRIACATSREELRAAEKDLHDAYADWPEGVGHLLDLAHVRVASAAMGVRSISIRESDVVFRCETPEQIANALREAKGTVRILAPKKGDDHFEVYYRPPKASLDPVTLLRVLVEHLAPNPEQAHQIMGHR